MKPQEVTVKDNMKITLIADERLLDEMVVTAFGEQKRSAFTGSAAIVEAKTIETKQLTNVLSALQGEAADIDYFSGVTGQAIYQLGSDNRFIWRNLLGSGIDLQFKIDGYFDSEDVHNSYGGVTPLDHYQGDEFGWMFMRDASPSSDSEDYMTWTPEGGAGSIESYIYFFYPYEGYEYYTWE